jgi:hypothetical protein
VATPGPTEVYVTLWLIALMAATGRFIELLPAEMEDLARRYFEMHRNRWVDPTWCLGNLAGTMRGCADGTQPSNDKN